MDREDFMRLAIGFLIGACLWAAGNRAHATTIPATPSTQTQPASTQTQSPVLKYFMSGTGQTAIYDTELASCSAWTSSIGATAPRIVTGGCSGGASAPCCWYTSGGNAAGNITVSSAQSCVAGYALQNGQCVSTSPGCPSGWTQSGSTCSQTTYSCPANYTLSGTVCNSNPDASGTQGPQLCIPATGSPGAGACYNGTLYDYQTASNQFAIGGVQQWCGPTQSSFSATGSQNEVSSRSARSSPIRGLRPGTTSDDSYAQIS